MTSTFRQGAMSGGGYIQAISISNDGLTFVISYDSAGAWIWNNDTEQWDNVFSQDRMPAGFTDWGGADTVVKAFTSNAVVVAPSDSDRVYALVLNTGGGNSFPAMVWVSDDRCQTWVDTEYRLPAVVTDPRGIGPKIVVDPANPDVVYIQDNAGVVHRSFDAGETWERPTELTDLMTQATTTAGTANGGTVITMGGGTPANVQTRNGYTVYAANISRTTSILAGVSVSSANATTATMNLGITGAITSGDVIVFGYAGGIAFDPTSGTTGGRTNRIFVGFGYGSDAVYVSDDAGATWDATVDGPAATRYLHCSHDGILYACSYLQAHNQENTDAGLKNAWKYASDTWSNFTAITGANGNAFSSCAADPLNAGRVVFMTMSGGMRMSTNYGSTWTANSTVHTRVGSDVPWLSDTLENWMTHGQCQFDPVVSSRLWIGEGIGVWSCTPSYTNATQTMTSRNKNWQGLIVDEMVKPPGGSLIVAVQDRAAVKLDDFTEEPANDAGIMEANNQISSGWSVDYAKDDPTFLALLVTGGFVWVSTDRGATWTKKTAQPSGVNAGGCLAVQTSQNMVWFSANNGTPAYTTDGGTSWSSCLFAGNTISTGWSGNFIINRHIAVADMNDPDTYYAYNDVAPNVGLWKSTDGGANWTKIAAGLNLGLAQSQNARLISIPGKPGHLMYATGTNATSKLRRTTNEVDWHSLDNTARIWQVAWGKALPGKSYPSIYIAGTLAGETDAGIYRADDFTDNTAEEPNWWKLSGALDGNMDYVKAMCGDPDEAGRVYIGFGSSGYGYLDLGSAPYTLRRQLIAQA